MKIWVDADACPKPVKEILFRVAKRIEIEVTLVANQPSAGPAFSQRRCPTPLIGSGALQGGGGALTCPPQIDPARVRGSI